MLSSGTVTKLAGVACQGGNHWVAVIIDYPILESLYGDSFGKGPDPTIRVSLIWWMKHHIQHTFTMKGLSIMKQKDNYSCGFMAFNAITHHILPKKHPMLLCNDTDNG